MHLVNLATCIPYPLLSVTQYVINFFFDRKIIPKDTYVDSRMFAMRCADQV